MKQTSKFKGLKKVLMVASLMTAVLAQAATGTAADEKLEAEKFRASLTQQAQLSGQKIVEQRRVDERAAEQDISCQRVDRAAMNAANSVMARNTPPDPSKIIQNTTCFVDISAVKIPVVITGMGFIDAIIKKAIQRFMTGACAKSQNFLADLQNSAIKKLDSGLGGSLQMAYSLVQHPQGSLQESLVGAGLDSIQNAGSNLVGGLVSSSNLTQAGSGQSGAIDSGAANGTLDGIRNDYNIETIKLNCRYMNTPNDTYCPLCMNNPMHPDCIGERPYCDPVKYPNVKAPYCIEYSYGGSDGG